MHDLTTAVVLPAARVLGLDVFTAEATGVVLAPLPAPDPATPALTFAFIPNITANDIVIEVALFRVPPTRQATVALFFVTAGARYKGITWMLDAGMAYVNIHVALAHAADAPATVAAAFERLAHALSETAAEIVRLATGAPKRRSRIEREAAAIVAPFGRESEAA